MTLPVVLSFAALAFIALLALLWSRWPVWLKALLVVAVSGFYFYANDVVHGVWGWPSTDPLPERFVLLAAIIEEPTAKRPGALYVWVNAMEDGKPAAQPRAFRLPYAKDLHALLNEGMKKIREGVSQVGTSEPKVGKGGLSWLRPGNDEQIVKLRDLPVPQLPEKLKPRPIKRCAALALVLLGLAGCQRQTPSEALFPLEAGHRWTYRVTTRTGEDTSERESLTLRTMGPEAMTALDGKDAFRRRSDSGVDYWLRADETGVYRVATKSDLEAEPRLDKPLRFVLKAPYTVGTQWQAATTSYLLMRRNEFPREIRHSHPSIPMNYQIEAVAETVDTPAGHFDTCLKVRGTGSVRVYADPASGWKDMPLTTTEWYCKGVGLVKLERNEPAQSAFLTGGNRTLELESWQ